MTTTHEPGIGFTIDESEQRKAAFLNGLRDLTAHLAANPDLLNTHTEVTVVAYSTDADEFARRVRLLGGERDKKPSENFYGVERHFGPAVTFRLIADREQVCERVLVGTDIEERPIMEQVGFETVETARYEWRCTSILDGAS